jgi:ATP-dependent helicase/nuclease subunit A
MKHRTAWNTSDYANPAAILERWKRLADKARLEARQEFVIDSGLQDLVKECEEIACSDAGDKLYPYFVESLDSLKRILNDPKEWKQANLDVFLAVDLRGGKSGCWGGKENLARVKAVLKILREKAAEYADVFAEICELDEQAATTLSTLTKLAVDANRRYVKEKRSRGLLDFEDLLEQAGKLLRDNPDVRKGLGDGIDQLLVDEAQDTDKFQVDMLRLLMFGDSAAAPNRKGGLFLVGDSKQSIYRFRGAQVEVFDDWCRQLGRDQLEELNQSFRMHEAGTEFINHVFKPLMGGDYSPIRPADRPVPQSSTVEILIADTPDKPLQNADDATYAQAAVVAQRIRRMIDAQEALIFDAAAGKYRPTRYGDIAILFARMTKSLDYERALTQWGVPHYVVAGTGFFQQQEVFDILNVLRAVENPGDDVAFFGTLRSGLFGLDDNALLHIAEACQPPYFQALSRADLSGRLGNERDRTLRRAMAMIARLHNGKDALGVDGVIDAVLEETSYEAVLLSSPQGKRMLGNVRMLTEKARAAAASHMALGDFLRQMDDLVLNESRYEQAAVAGEAEDVVRLMTIHKAKGLEFPVVIVPDLNAGRKGIKDAMLNRLDWGWTLRLAPVRDEENDDEDAATLPTSYRLACRMEKLDQRREDVRKLYVAMTRHKDYLSLVGANLRGKIDGIPGDFKEKDGYLSQLDRLLNLQRLLPAGGEIPYADGKFSAAVRVVAAGEPPAGYAAASQNAMLESARTPRDLAEAIVQSANASGESLSLAGPLPVRIGHAQLAVTALGDFETCPLRYRWQYELRVPSQTITSSSEPASPQKLNAARLGTLVHRSLELFDFRDPLDATGLIRRAAEDLDFPTVDFSDASFAAAKDMLRSFGDSPIAAELARARSVHRELDFWMDLGPGTLGGKIDVLYHSAEGQWRILDYKSDHVDAEGAAERAAGYELQLLLYAAAAKEFAGSDLAGAKLYFLRPGREHEFAVNPDSISAAKSRAIALLEKLLAARRRGEFPACPNDKCRFCPYANLCPKKKAAE